MRSHDAIAIVSSHRPKGTILQFWGNSRILNAIHNHSANSSANRTITLWFRHNPPDCGGFTPCRSASISIHTILWSFLQAIPDQKIHQQLQNLLTILGCLPQSVWNLNYIAIASQERIAGWLKGLHRNWVDCRTTAEDHDHVSQFLNSTSIHVTALPPNVLRGSWIAPFFLQITPQCRWISRQFPNLMQSFTIQRIAEGIGPGLWLGSDIDTDTRHKGGVCLR